MSGKLCECGCGLETNGYDPQTGHPRRYRKGHWIASEAGKRQNAETRARRVAENGRCEYEGGRTRCKMAATHLFADGVRLCFTHSSKHPSGLRSYEDGTLWLPR